MRLLLLTSAVTAIVSTAIIVGAGFALKHVLESGDVVTAATIGLSCGAGVFFLFRGRNLKRCGQATGEPERPGR